MDQQTTKKRKHGFVQRLFAAIGVFAFLITTLLVLIFELTAIYIGIYIAALSAIVGPAFTEGADSILEIITGILELVIEGVAMVVDAIASLFSGF